MAFTDEEKRRWHEKKRKREYRPTPAFRLDAVAVCMHCQNPFGINEGVITTASQFATFAMPLNGRLLPGRFLGDERALNDVRRLR